MGGDGIGVEWGGNGGPNLGGRVDRTSDEEVGKGGEKAESGTEEAGAGCDASRGTGRDRSETVVIILLCQAINELPFWRLWNQIFLVKNSCSRNWSEKWEVT